ncbi:ectin-like [Watersipora subatra]|uniref:ectin-like n=1 Tax=Watersipora subatra TaxID=2589382 RepID=UPI00355BB75B
MDFKLLAILLVVGVVGVINAGYPYPPKHRYGYWSSWSRWSRCNVPCGGGTQSRARHCLFDRPGHPGGYGCTAQQSPQSQRRACNTHCCPVNGNWSGWSRWSYVHGSQQYKYYLQERTRTCTNPPPSCGGRPCYGDSRQTRKIFGRY